MKSVFYPFLKYHFGSCIFNRLISTIEISIKLKIDPGTPQCPNLVHVLPIKLKISFNVSLLFF